MMKYILPMVLALTLTGCVSSGTQVKEQQLTQFKKGETTYGQVIAALGQPNSNTLMPDGGRMLMYNYFHFQERAESFIPYIGPLVGGADVHTSMVMLRFDPQGKLIDYTASTGQQGSGANLAAGPSQPRTHEPRAAGEE